MNDFLFKHVLFKDLADYLKRTDYMAGYTDKERAWIRKNLDVASKDEVNDLIANFIRSVFYVTREELLQLMDKNKLTAGYIYIITDYSENYQLMTMATSTNTILSQVYVLGEDSNLWDVKYDIYSGKIVYLKDQNENIAHCDFKTGAEGYIFITSDGNDNSSNCFGNDVTGATNIKFIGNSSHNVICGDSITFKVPVNNLKGTLNNTTIDTDTIGLNSDNPKQVVSLSGKTYIDWIDSETLTHQYYAL